MSKEHISDELWLGFLGGNVSEEETGRLVRLMAEDEALLEEYLSVSESLKRVDSQPLTNPDLDLAQKQTAEALGISRAEKGKVVMLPHRPNRRKHILLAAASALLIVVALFFLFRPDRNENNRFAPSVIGNITNVRVWVYDRRGQQVAYFEGPDGYWDGRDPDGNPLPQGVYVYILRYRSSLEPNITQESTGTVMLLR